jgi:phosphoribosylformylglycinamidine cyclo-ligase
MLRTFNCGVGMVAIVDDADADAALHFLAEQGEGAWILGRVAVGAGGVEYV